jgi:selenocysteine lyase/cysteine desulfurase
VPIDLAATPVDLLTATGKKALLGPRGTGLAVVSERLRDLAVPDSIDVHTHDFDPSGEIRPSTAGARRYELGEKCVSSFVGLKTALDQAAMNDWEKIERHSAALLDAVRSIPGIEVYTAGQRNIGIVSLNHRALPAELLWDSLCDAEVACWLICGEHTPNFLLRQGVRRAVRLAVGPRTEPAEIEYAVGVLTEIAARYREPAWASS